MVFIGQKGCDSNIIIGLRKQKKEKILSLISYMEKHPDTVEIQMQNITTQSLML